MPRSARRKQLLHAARETFVAQGYHAAAMDDIAERAGVSKPVLYQHFPGKFELYLALIDEHTAELVDRVRGALRSTTDNKQRVEATLTAFFDFVEHEGEAFRLVFESDLRSNADVAERLDGALESCAELVGQVIAEDTDVSADAARLMARGIVGYAEVSARYWLAQGGRVSKEEAVGVLARLTWRGISGWPRTT
ncbi:MAG: TetR/AcrR family transcriptional regulator [Streptosporangiales bacterium]|nr:TetR/AcrR family transcriptional regulator [Streptosporangiales bacterium]